MALVVILVVLLASRTFVDWDGVGLAGVMGAGQDHVVAVPLTIAVFIAAAFVGVPQWVLIGGAVVVFGPVLGAGVSWAATMLSALINFALGRAMGGERLRAKLGPRVGRWVDRVSDQGLVAAFLVRLVPTGPFVLINLAAGASTMSWRDFGIGTALGIIPKILAIALFGQGLLELVRGDNRILAAGVLLVAAGLAVGLWWVRRRGRARLGAAENAHQSETRP